jgi:hypothetical protein
VYSQTDSNVSGLSEGGGSMFPPKLWCLLQAVASQETNRAKVTSLFLPPLIATLWVSLKIIKIKVTIAITISTSLTDIYQLLYDKINTPMTQYLSCIHTLLHAKSNTHVISSTV